MSPPKRAPDLLFEEERDARVLEIAPLLEQPQLLDAGAPMHRLTVFLTYRCNLACPYCKTIARSEEELTRAPQKRLSFDLKAFELLLNAHADTPLRHLHFTGGEASIVPELVQMVGVAKRRGVEAISLTSNGTLAPELYLELVRAGLDELRVSIDANEPALGAELTQRPGAFAATVRTLEALRDARRAGARFTLILNSVVGLENRRRLPTLLRFLLGFAPDDVKLITEVNQRDRLGDFAEAEAVRAEVEALLLDHPPEALPLLRRKIQTVFARDAIGIAESSSRAAADWRCYIPLTERTVDRASYYPCSVYLREGGAPLGPLTDPPELQRQRSARFVREHACLSDPICRRYCLHCTRAFNDRANDARSMRADPRWTYLLISPLGMAQRGWLEEQLKARGVELGPRTQITDWPRLSTTVYLRGHAPERLQRAALFEQAWRSIAPDGRGEAWAVDPAQHAQVARDKHALRAQMNDVRLPFGALHAFHLADPEDALTEARRIETELACFPHRTN